MMNLVFPNYEKSLLNIASTILTHYGVKTQYKSIESLKAELDKNYRNVVVFLIDAMGSEILGKHTEQTSFLLDNTVEILTTVFPSTTVSATTSILTGKPPVSTGWVGWLQYVKEEDRSVIFFLNKDFYDEKHEFNYNVSEKFASTTKIYDLINGVNPEVKTIEIFPEFRTPEHKTFKNLCDTVLAATKESGKHFIYAYWDKVDTYLHKNGTTSEIVRNHLSEINGNIKELISELDDDTLVIITADHGQIDIEEVELGNYTELINTFRHNPSVEARATAFFIKEGMEEKFEDEFNRNFRDQFILYKSEDFLNTHLLGYGEEHYKLREFLGDYFSIAIDKYSFKLVDSKREFMAQHAGLTKDEMLIPLIIISPKK